MLDDSERALRASTPGAYAAGVFDVLARHRDFRWLWSAQVVSQAGDWLNRVACLALVGALGERNATVGVGLLFGFELALRLLPSAVLGPLAGPVADRLPRRALMVAADLVRAAVVAAMFLVREPQHLPALYTLLALQMGVGIFFDAARTAALPSTVTKSDLHAAQVLSSATWSVMLSVGALAGGGLAALVGTHTVFLIDAGTYALSALCLSRLRLAPHSPPSEPFSWRAVLALDELRRAREHVRALGIEPVIWTKTYWGAAGGFLVLLGLAGHDRYGEDGAEGAAGAAAFATGVLYAARGVGTGLGPIVARRMFGGGDAGLLRQIWIGFVVAALGYAAFGVPQSLASAALWVGIAHLGGATIWVASTVFWQRKVEDSFRGRVFAIEYVAMDVAFAAGGLSAGLLYDLTGSLAWTTWAVSAAILALGTRWKARSRRIKTAS